MPIHLRLCAAFLVCLAPTPGLAERADREQPVNIEANRVAVDNRKKVHVFEGNVVLRQGTLLIRSEKLVVTEDPDGFQQGTATGGENGLASFRQRREGRSDFVEGRAERIDYDSRLERATLTGRAEVKSGGDEVRGQYIEYEGNSEKYLVTNTTPASATPEAGARVRAVIQPREAAKNGGTPPR